MIDISKAGTFARSNSAPIISAAVSSAIVPKAAVTGIQPTRRKLSEDKLPSMGCP
jgi:hypothetical protein